MLDFLSLFYFIQKTLILESSKPKTISEYSTSSIIIISEKSNSNLLEERYLSMTEMINQYTQSTILLSHRLPSLLTAMIMEGQ